MTNVYQDINLFNKFTHRDRFEMEASEMLEIGLMYLVANRYGTSYLDEPIALMFIMWQNAVQTERQSDTITINL